MVATRWVYTPVIVITRFKPLAEIAIEGREPNFFELLKAGILSGSIGLAAADTRPSASSVQNTLDGVADLQILRIGANILNCVSPTNFSITIAVNYGTSSAPLYVPVHGVADLPYLYGMDTAMLRSLTPSGANYVMNYCAGVMVPLLFNPYQPASPALASANTPAAVRIRVYSGSLLGMVVDNGTPVVTPTAADLAPGAVYNYLEQTPLNQDLTTSTPITIPSTAFSSFYTKLKAVSVTDNSTVGTELKTLVSGYPTTGNYGTADGFVIYAYPTQTTLTGSTFPGAPGEPSARNHYVQLANLQVVMEYLDPQGVWHIYDDWGGNEAYSTTSGLQSTGNGFGLYTYLSTTGTPPKMSLDIIGHGWIKLDPRTGRLGCQHVFAARPFFDDLYHHPTLDLGHYRIDEQFAL